MKKLLHLKTLALLCAFIAGSMSAWASPTTYSFSNIPTKGWSTNGGSQTINNISWTYSEATYIAGSAGSIQIGSKNNPQTSDWTIQTPITSFGTNKKVTAVSITARTTNTTATYDISVGGSSVSNGDLTTTSAIFKAENLSVTTGSIVVTMKGSSGSAAMYLTDISVTYDDASTDPSITASDVEIAADATSGEFAYSISNPVDGASFTATVTDGSAWLSNAVVDTTNGKVTFTTTANTDYDNARTGTIHLVYGNDLATKDVTVTQAKAIRTYTATFSINGVTTTAQYAEGAAITFPENPDDIEGKTFVGWTATAISGIIDEAPEFVSSAKMGTEDVTFYAVFATKIAGNAVTVTDELTPDWTGATGSTYSDWKDKTATSAAVYAGNSAGGNSSIQLRSNNNNSGIISTTSGGLVKKVTVKWNSNTSTGRKLNVYGETAKYTKVENLYSNQECGTLLGSIECNKSTELVISGDYKYVGLRSASNAMYIDKISIDWQTGTPDSYSSYCTTVAADTREEAGISFADATVTQELAAGYTGQILINPNDLSVTWTSSNEDVATVDENGILTVKAVGETIITAAFAGDDTYKKGTASYTLTIQDSREAIELSFAEPSVSVNVNETVAAPVLNGNTGNGAVTYASADEKIASVDPATGVVTGVADGVTTITATVEATDSYQGGTATFTVTVIDPNKKGTANNPYTVAEARAAIDAGTGITNVYAKGIVSQAGTLSSGAISYYISDDGKDTSDQLQAYKGKGLNGEAFTSADDIQVGDEVTIYGTLKKYNSIYEFDSGNYLVKFNRPVDTTPSITLSTNSVEATAAGADGTITVTYNNITTVVAEVKFYEADKTTEAEYNWIYAEINADNNVEYLIEANTGEARTAYLKVHALDDNAKDVYSELITITQSKPVVTTTYTLATAITSGKHYIITSGTESDVKAMGEQNTNNRKAVDVTITDGKASVSSDAGICEFVICGPDANGRYTIYDETASGYLYAASSGSNYLKTQANNDVNSQWTIEKEDEGNFLIKADGSNNRNVMQYNSSSTLFSCYSSDSQKDIYLFEKEGEAAPTETITITDAKYATYCSKNAIDFTGTGLTAYIAKVAGGKVTFEEKSKIPAYQGVLLKGDAGSYNVNMATSVDDVKDNDFIGVTEPTEKEAGIYVLRNESLGVGFYETKYAFTVGANTAYLPALADEARMFIGLEDATAIEGIVAETKADGTVYNLQGQRVSAAKKGLYIVDGKKMLVK